MNKHILWGVGGVFLGLLTGGGITYLAVAKKFADQSRQEIALARSYYMDKRKKDVAEAVKQAASQEDLTSTVRDMLQEYAGESLKVEEVLVRPGHDEPETTDEPVINNIRTLDDVLGAASVDSDEGEFEETDIFDAHLLTEEEFLRSDLPQVQMTYNVPQATLYESNGEEVEDVQRYLGSDALDIVDQCDYMYIESPFYGVVVELEVVNVPPET